MNPRTPQDTIVRSSRGSYRKGMDARTLRLSIGNQLKYTLAKDESTATLNDWYLATALAVRDRLVDRWIETQRTYYRVDAKRIYYLSLEYLPGRMLLNALVNLGIEDACRAALRSFGVALEDVVAQEHDPGLGNGGLGRLAACFLDSLASLGYPATGYGLRYEFGLFTQVIRDGAQEEEADSWLRSGNPWEIPRPEYTMRVRYGGRSVPSRDAHGRLRFLWVDTEDVLALPYDTPIPGHGTPTVNNLRLWAARPVEAFDFEYFNSGDYIRAIEQKARSENITRALYPNDNIALGQELRLRQEYFLVSASIQDIVRRYRKHHTDWAPFPQKVAIQLNDTHPALAIPELLRILLDEGGLEWEPAWEITWRTFGFTNHTLLPEALERWRVDMLGRLLPRHLELIYEINRRFLDDVRARAPEREDLLRRVSLVEEEPVRSVRMAHLAIVGSRRVNGVAQLHGRLLREHVFRDFAELFPDRFLAITNGITQRRFLRVCNPALAALCTEAVGEGWITDLERLRGLEAFAQDSAFRARWRAIRRAAKERLAARIRAETGVQVSPDALFDVHVKRIHEYKRQHLNVLRLIDLYHRIREMPHADWVPQVAIFSGKAAPGYAMAKLIIRLIHAVADVVHRDPVVGDRLRIVFLPNYGVSLAEEIIPAADLSQQISTAGREASGTGNMKFALNGALTIGTLDGANIEIRDAVGPENFFLFGLSAEEIAAMAPSYRPAEWLERDPRLKRILDEIAQGRFSPQNPTLFGPLVERLRTQDPFFLLPDFASYVERHDEAVECFRDPDDWFRRGILNAARIGRFSSDRAVREYAALVWEAEPVTVRPGG